MPLLSCDDILVNETAGFAILTLRLDAAAAVPLSVTWNTSSSSADSGSDYTGVGATVLTFAAGQTVQTVQVPLINDAFVEGNENFFINLSSPSAGLTLERSFAIVTIAANDRGDRAPVASVADTVVDEGNGTANFAITLDRASLVPVTVTYTTSSGTATAGSDFTATTGSITFAAGETVKIVPVSIANDAASEGAEAFRFTLTGISGVAGALLGDSVAEGWIGLSDTPPLATPTVSVDDAVFSEAEANGLIRVTFRLNAPSAVQTSVDWRTSSNTADSGSDFTGLSNRLVFAAGETVKTIQIPVINDATPGEGVEHFFISLSNASGLNIDRPFATLSIVDNDNGVRAPIASIGDAVVDETDGAVFITILLDQSSGVPVTVSYSTADGSAVAGADFTTTTGTVTFNPGETAKTIRINIANDTLAEIRETFDFRLDGITGVTGAAIGDGLAKIVIGASDTTTLATPTISVDDMMFSEGEASGVMLITFNLSAPSANRTQVDWSTFGVTADSGSDFTGLRGTLAFDPGETIKTVRIPVINDAFVESTQQFRIGLSNEVGLRIDQPFATISIVDNDSGDRAPVVSVSDATVDETDGFANFAITLDRASSVPVTVSYRTVTGTAGTSDFTGEARSVTFNPFETVKTISIAITNDARSENAEAFTLKLTGISGVTGAAIGDGVGAGTIGLSDRATVATPQLSVTNVSDMEGGDGVMTFAFRLNAPSNAATSFTFSTSRGSADSGSDFASTTSTLTFAPGETLKTIQVPIINDATVETDEVFTLNLFNPVGLILPTAAVTGTIRDNDAARVSIATTEAEVSEGTGAGGRAVTLFIHREGDTTTSQAVNWAVSPATKNGVNAADFVGGVLPRGTVTFAVGEITKTITLQTVRDSLFEANESFRVVLNTPTAGLRIENGATDVTILNDDVALQSQFSVAALNANLTEGASGTTPFTFTVTRGGDASGSGSVAYTITGNGAAPATAADFVGGAFPGGTVAFVAGETSKTVTVAVLGDAESELDEMFTVSLNAPVGGTISGTAATGVIRNDDGGTITGTSGADALTGSTGNDTMSGLAGNDRIDGGGGVDRITGGLGADRLSGGALGDTFIFSTLQDSTSALAGRDQISDFAGSLGDRIDLSAIDANSILAGNDAFVLVAADFTGVAGEISMTSWGTTWLVRADVDGDGVADFALTVLSADTLTTTDFIL